MSVVSLVPPGPVATLPPGSWIPNPDQLTDSAAGLLCVMGQALDDYGMGELFTRRVYTLGDTVPLHRGQTTVGQLLVAMADMELGEAGQRQFQFQKGAIGTHVHAVARFDCQLWLPWAPPNAGLSARLPEDEVTQETTRTLHRAVFVVFAALRALSMAGAHVTPLVTPIVQDGIIVGPIAPAGPQGGLAGFKVQVQVAYD